ncbi:hypothetical protein [Paenibacillus sp. NPDC057967]|uniref:hypothetical protein n=1 Tax=Paenibacillus sp. NPDC057967 TaxID=3346293 RepID=UPI0036D953DB
MNGMEAGHLTDEQLRRYICNELTPGEREHADSELEVCEGCLWRFMAMMEEADNADEPLWMEAGLPDMARMEDAVMAALMHTDAGEAEHSPFIEVAPSPVPDRLPMVMKEETQEKKPPEPADDTKPVQNGKQQQERKQADRRTTRERGSWLQHPVTHYTIAASITLMLLATGALTSFSQSLQQLHERDTNPIPPQHVGAEWMSAPSWSDRLVNQAGNWLDGIQSWRFK